MKRLILSSCLLSVSIAAAGDSLDFLFSVEGKRFSVPEHRSATKYSKRPKLVYEYHQCLEGKCTVTAKFLAKDPCIRFFLAYHRGMLPLIERGLNYHAFCLSAEDS